MVNVNMRSSRPTKSDVADEPESNSIRGRKVRENQAKLRALKKPGVRVVPAEDHPRLSVEQIRKHITHAPSGVRFRTSGSIEWPNDRFTQRRIREGVVKVVNEKHDEKSDQDKRKPQQPLNRPAPQQQRQTATSHHAPSPSRPDID